MVDIYSNLHMRHLLAQEDILASEGLDTLRAKNRTLYELVNAHWGTGRPKLPHGGTAYGNEIIRSAHWGAKNNFSAKAAYKVGGVRVQSFSDYEANMFFDYMQLFADMAARELPSHAYTKEATYARLFGMTGQKINLSVVAKAAELTEKQQKRYKKLAKDGKKALLEDPEFKEIADHAGLAKDKNGNWTRLLVEDETFPLEEAKKIQNDPRYSSNCGIIWIGVSDAQIRVLLDSEDVPMVIPYHESGVSAFIKNARNLLLYKNYEDEQNTRNKSDGKKISGKDFDFYESLYRTNDPAATANEYKEWCEKHNYLPKFDQFKDHPNYYKLLVDFRVYDYNGVDPAKMANRKYLPQGAVTMTFPETREFNKLVKDSLAEQQGTKDRLLDELTTEQGSLISAVKDAIGLDDDGRRTAGEDIRRSVNIDEDIRRSLVVDDGVDMDDIDDFVDTIMANNGQSGRKYNQVTIKELTETDVENIRKATGGRVNANGKHYALEGSKLFHEIRNHSESSHNQHSWQLTYERNNVPEIIETMLHPDIVEDLGDVYTEDQRENIAFVKEQNGSYIVVVAVGGRRNKAITAEMILRFKTEELNERLKNGTVAELIYAEAAKKLSEEQLNSIKKNRVTAVIHESLDSFSQTSETILRSPLFDSSVTQNGETDKRNSVNVDTNSDGEILYDGKVATEAQIEESDIYIRRSVRVEDPPKKTITAYKVFVAFENDPGHLYPPMVASPGGVATPVGVWLDADTGAMARDKDGNIIVNKKGRVQVQQGGKGTNKAKSGTLAWRPGWHLGEYPDAKQFAVKDPVTGKAKSAFPAHFIFAECEIAADVDYQLEAMEYGVSKKGGFNRTQAGLPYVPKNGSYRYRTNADPTTAPWYITGAMKVNRNYRPKFDQFKDHPNYYKLLVDFCVYNTTTTALILRRWKTASICRRERLP